jgi:hypothetical protein
MNSRPVFFYLSYAYHYQILNHPYLYNRQADAVAKRAWYRNVTMYGFHALVVLVIGNNVRDTQCGFKLFTRETARLLFYNMRMRRWCFDVELIRLAQHFQVPVAEVAVNWTEVPGSKLSVLRASIRMAIELFMLTMGYNISKWWTARDPRADIAAEGTGYKPATALPPGVPLSNKKGN